MISLFQGIALWELAGFIEYGLYAFITLFLADRRFRLQVEAQYWVLAFVFGPIYLLPRLVERLSDD